MDYLQTCPLCKKQYFGPHYCGAIHKPQDDGARSIRPLSEADVRRIVREELDKEAAMTPAQVAHIMALVPIPTRREGTGAWNQWEVELIQAYARAAVEAALRDAPQQAEPTRSQKLRDAGYTRRPTWKSLPRDDDDEQNTSAPTAVEPDERAAFQPDELEQIVDRYLDEYELIGEDCNGLSGCYTPTDTEKALIKDAICGLLADAEWDAAWGRQIDAARASKGTK